MIVYKFFKILFIFTRHGINPFRDVDTNKDKMIEKLTEKEKKWIIDNSKGYTKNWFKEMFEMY